MLDGKFSFEESFEVREPFSLAEAVFGKNQPQAASFDAATNQRSTGIYGAMTQSPAPGSGQFVRAHEATHPATVPFELFPSSLNQVFRRSMKYSYQTLLRTSSS